MNKKLKIVLYIVIVLLVIIVGFSLWYVNDYYHADDSVTIYLNGTDNVSVISVKDGLFLDGPGNSTALIFYPGAKIEYTSYLPLLMNLSSNGVDCFLVEMPFNLAFLGSDKADSFILNSSYNYSNWYISGHSLGGAMASSYVNNYNYNNITGLILLASYPSEKLNNISVLSIYGSNDKVLNMDNYNKGKSYIPKNFTEDIIKGGNHAQFAYYGNQSSDGIASISTESQINQTVNDILSFIGV